MRVAYDPVGGNFVDRYVEALTPRAQVFLYGTLSDDRVNFGMVELVRKQPTIYPHSLYNHVCHPDEVQRGVEFLSAHLSAGRLRPVIDTVFPFERALEAYDYLKTNQQIGKVVVSVG